VVVFFYGFVICNIDYLDVIWKEIGVL